jgi:hypothetical protein
MKQQFCTWELTDEYYDVWRTDCDQTEIFPLSVRVGSDFKYCPYCGKNIKLKEEK